MENGASQLQPSVPHKRTPRSSSHIVAALPMPQPESTKSSSSVTLAGGGVDQDNLQCGVMV